MNKMTNIHRISLYAIIILFIIPDSLLSQKLSAGAGLIDRNDLETYVTFLASPNLKGRSNGENELNITTDFLAAQAKLIGLQPANGNSYLQPYVIIKKSVDNEKTRIQVTSEDEKSVMINQPLIQLLPNGASDFDLEGEVVFAGYGIKADKYNYNDFENLDTEGKIILMMTRSPLSEDGKKYLFEEPVWSTFMSLQLKLSTLMFSKAKAILFVPDPKSGCSSVEQQYPGIANELKSSKYLKGSKPAMFEMPGLPKIMFVHREVADELLKGSGYSLDELQRNIDSELKPFSFTVAGKKLLISEVSRTDEVIMSNVAGWIEGSDPVLKKEFVIFSGHADHIGGSGDKINAGADDNASGCAAILEIAEAFQSLDKKPLRSLLFLWVTGEEIGLFGSQYYVDNPLFPLENTIVDLNMDMIGRVKGVADTTSETPMTGPADVFIITGNQSRELMEVAQESDKRSPLSFDYSLSGRNSPLQLFSRSDHYNFVRKDIPVLCFTSGLHSDYHTTGDVIEKIDFGKMELIAKTVYDIGYSISNKRNRLIVDNPFSKW